MKMDQFSIPYIEGIKENMSSCSCLKTLDLFPGFWDENALKISRIRLSLLEIFVLSLPRWIGLSKWMKLQLLKRVWKKFWKGHLCTRIPWWYYRAFVRTCMSHKGFGGVLIQMSAAGQILKLYCVIIPAPKHLSSASSLHCFQRQYYNALK